MKKRAGYIISTIVVLAIVMLVLMMNKKTTQDKTRLAAAVSSAIPVQIEAVKASVFNPSFSSNGALEPIRELSMMSDVVGRVVSVMVDEGTSVAKGEPLAQIDTEMLQADFNANQATYNALKKDYERFKSSNEQGGVTAQQLDNMQTQLIAAQSRLAVSARRLADATIKSPISGVVNKRYVEVGAYLNPGARIVDIIDNSSLRVWCNVTEHQVLQIRQNQDVRLSCSTFPDESYIGKINFVGQKADRSMSFPVEILISGPQKKELKAGMYVTAHFDAKTTSEGILISRNAISGSVKSAYVYVVKNGIAHKQEVGIGGTVNKNVHIISGLHAGDSVVVAGLINVAEGANVVNVK